MYEIQNVPKRVMFSGCRGSFGFIYVGDILVKKNWRKEILSFYNDEILKQVFIKILIIRFDVATARLELMTKEQRRTQAPLIFLTWNQKL